MKTERKTCDANMISVRPRAKFFERGAGDVQTTLLLPASQQMELRKILK